MALFRGGDRDKQESGETPAVVAVFGKHPSSREFYRINTSPTVREFDEWLGQALATCERVIDSWPKPYKRAPLVSFVYHAYSTSRSLLGTLAPSRDEQGRRYPLAVVAELDSVALADRYAGLPYLQFLADVQAGLSRRDELTPEMLGFIPERLVPPDGRALQAAQDEHHAFVGGASCGQVLAPLFADAPEGQLARALDNLRLFGQAMGGGRAPRYGVRCPLGPAFGASVAGFWLDLVYHATRAPVLPTALWTDRTLLVYCGRPSSKALAALWRPGWQDDTVLDLASTSSGSTDQRPRNDQLLHTLLG